MKPGTFGSDLRNPMLNRRVIRAKAVRHSWALRAITARERDGWRNLAPCKGRSELFHGGNNDQLKHARTICDGCPVRLDCLAACYKAESAIDPRYWHGVFGGLSANERRDAIVAERQAESNMGATGCSSLDRTQEIPAAFAAPPGSTRESLRRTHR